MRPAILAVALGGVLLAGTACDSEVKTAGTAAPPSATPSSEPSIPAPDYSANTKAICGKLEKIFNEDLEGFGTQVGKMIAYKESKQTAQAAKAQKAAAQELENVATKVKQETSAAQDPALRMAGAASAAKFAKSANDPAFLDKIKSTQDLSRTIEGQMTEWLNPVAGYCA
jgi:hypothetical protein